jgi:dipeptidyl aminopeptidase/acylaminoacyl peptidase
MNRTTRPYGNWTTDITPDVLASVNVRLAWPEILPDGSFIWLEGRPAEQGRYVVVRKRRASPPEDVLPSPFNARSRVHEYGGLPFAFVGEDLYFVGYGDQRLHRARPGSTPAPLGGETDVRLAELRFDAARNRLVAVAERHAAGSPPENGLVAIDLERGAIEWLIRGRDFFAAPAISPSGDEIAYLAWDQPHMPWDAASLHRARFDPGANLAEPRHVAGGVDGSAFQPEWSPDGELFFALESNAVPWTIHRAGVGGVERVAPAGAEWGAALWNLGTKTYAFANARTIVGAVMQNGLSRIVTLDVTTGAMETVAGDVGYVGQLAARGDDVLFTIGWAGSGSAVVHLDLRDGSLDVVRDAFEPVTGRRRFGTSRSTAEPDAEPARDDRLVGAGEVSIAEPVTFPTTGGDVAHGFFYAPRSRRFEGPADERPPLVVICHGGPTGNACASLQLGIQHWTNQGFAVLDVNYRGSTGFGRPYRERLRGEWGALDVDDCVRGALWLADEGRVDRARLLVRGGSAGGFTVLMAMVRYPGVFAAGACHYGVSDPRSLAAATHKFEAQYDRFLFGDGAARERAFVERAPLARVGEITTPIVFFQGLEDRIVPPSQTEAMHRALEVRGVLTEYHGYPGEQHGFRRAGTMRDVYAKERAFYERVFANARR